ncbi:MAG: WS/DGAT domain-containing protein, partial [Ilumatobacter fluminis]
SEESAQLSEQLRKVSMPLTPAPPTPWNKAVGPHRRFAMRSVSLDDIKALKNATGGTVNDVVMAICAGALREYLLRHDALPDEPLRAMVPVSVRTGLEEDPWTNLVSSLVAELPTDCNDPLERVARCRDAMQVAKQQLDLVPADAIMRATDVTSPMVATAAIRLQARLADRFNMPVNVVVSNVPGPREPLYMAGAKLDGYIPVSTISNGVGLNITVHSYEDRLDFGLVADRDLVPDLWDLVDLHIDQIDALFDAAGVERTDRSGKQKKAAAKKSGTKKKAARKKRAAKKRAAS